MPWSCNIIIGRSANKICKYYKLKLKGVKFIMNEKDKIRKIAKELLEKGRKANNSEKFIKTQLDYFRSLFINLGYSKESIAFLSDSI